MDDGETVLAKAGDCLLMLESAGIDADCMDRKEIDRLAARMEDAFRVFDHRTVFHELYFRREVGEVPAARSGNATLDQAERSRMEGLRSQGLFEERLVYAVLYLDPRAERNLWQAFRNKQLASYFRRRQFQKLIIREIEESRERAGQKAREFMLQLRDVMKLRILDYQEGFLVLWSLLNFERPGELGPPNFELAERLDARLSDTFLDGGHDYSYLTAGRNEDYHVVVMGLKTLPLTSRPLMFRGLHEIRGNFHVVTTWKRFAPGVDLRRIQLRADHFWAQRHRGLRTSDNVPVDARKDGTKVQAARDLQKLEARISKSEYGGLYSLTVVAYDSDRKRCRNTVAELQAVFARSGAVLVPDRHNQQNGLFGTLPGAYGRLHRRFEMMNPERADLALWSLAAKGERCNSHLEADSLAMARTTSLTPFYFNLHGAKDSGLPDVAHTITTGMTGSGKSTFLSWVIASLQKYSPFIVIFDQGGSYAPVVRAAGGASVEVVPGRRAFRVNPFAHELTAAHHEFLAQFVRTLVECDGQSMTGTEEREVYAEIGRLYRLENPALRTLGCLAQGLPGSVSIRLSKWIGSGSQYGEYFDNVEDTVSLADLQYFDFPRDLDTRVMSALLLYIFNRVHEVVLDPARVSQLKAMVIDEGEVFAKNPQLCGYIVEAAKKWRKYNGAIVWIGQSIDALVQDEEIEKRVLRPLIQSCATQLFFSNPRIDGNYARLFGLTEKQVDIIRRLRGRDEVLFRQGSVVKRLSAGLDNWIPYVSKGVTS
jgi:type IV secretory pathway VirB4 component